MLIRKNVKVCGRRTSTKLEKDMWDALSEISSHTGDTIDDICSHVRNVAGEGNFTSNLRVFILNYFRFRPCKGQSPEN